MDCLNKKSIIYDEKAIGARIQKLREEKGVTQKAVGEILDLKPAGYSKLELGNSSLAAKHCISLADYFGVSCDYILRGIEVENVDVCTRTCLKQESIDSCADILNRQNTVSRRENELIRARAAALRTQEGFAFETNETMEYWRALHAEHVQSLFLKACGYLINSFLTDTDFINEIGHAAADAYSCTISYLYETFDDYTEFDREYPDDFKAINEDSYRRMINSCRFVANNAFANFFAKMIESSDFLSVVGGEDPDMITDSCLTKAIEAGIIKE